MSLRNPFVVSLVTDHFQLLVTTDSPVFHGPISWGSHCTYKSTWHQVLLYYGHLRLQISVLTKEESNQLNVLPCSPAVITFLWLCAMANYTNYLVYTKVPKRHFCRRYIVSCWSFCHTFNQNETELFKGFQNSWKNSTYFLGLKKSWKTTNRAKVQCIFLVPWRNDSNFLLHVCLCACVYRYFLLLLIC